MLKSILIGLPTIPIGSNYSDLRTVTGTILDSHIHGCAFDSRAIVLVAESYTLGAVDPPQAMQCTVSSFRLEVYAWGIRTAD